MLHVEKEFDNYSFGNECLAAHSQRLCATYNILMQTNYEERGNCNANITIQNGNNNVAQSLKHLPKAVYFAKEYQEGKYVKTTRIVILN